MPKITKRVEVAGAKLEIETGLLAKQSDGAVTVRQGDTVVFVSACAARSPRDVPFLPLTVDYREAMYAAGKIPGGFFKREGRPNEKETLTCRLIDRPMRPLFPAGWNFETQIIAQVLSSDQEHNADVLAITGASFAMAISDIPFTKHIAAVRVGLNDAGEYLINPTHEQMEESRLDLIVAASEDGIVMVEAGAQEVSEEEVIGGLFAGQEAAKALIECQRELREEVGKPKRDFTPAVVPDEILAEAREKIGSSLLAAMQVKDKIESYRQVDEVKASLTEGVAEEDPERAALLGSAFYELQDEILHDFVLEHGKRLDGRDLDEIRAIECHIGVLPRTHGSAVFQRGETQALVTTTLGTSADTQRLDLMEFEGEKRFMLHYNFPPYSVGEVRFLRGPGRREIGHGALAERALRPILPSQDDFPYVVRVVSDIMESNGSSSMASVCGGALSMMEAGVPILRPVAGIAMGLVEKGGKTAVLSDIAGAEDHHGDMDFKVTGSERGITALQMDIKIPSVTKELMTQALEQAKKGRMHILEKMSSTISEPRDDVSRYAPRIVTIFINREKIRDVIGPGGKVIRSIQEQTGCDISIEDDGRVDIASVDLDGARRAKEMIEELTAEAELGKIYVGKAVRTTGFGAFVEIMPGTEGLLHISEIADYRVKETTDEIQEGDEVLVKVIDIDQQGRVRLSRKQAMKEREEKSGASK